MKHETQINQTPPITLGKLFQQHREKLALSIDDVVAKTRLSRTMIRHLENDEFIVPAYPPTFMRGYVRTYAKFLKIPKDVWTAIEVDFGKPIVNDLHTDEDKQRKINPYFFYGKWVVWLTWLIILFSIGMTAYWWWQNHQQSQHERDHLVETFLNNNATEIDKLVLKKPKNLPNKNMVVSDTTTRQSDSTQKDINNKINVDKQDNNALLSQESNNVVDVNQETTTVKPKNEATQQTDLALEQAQTVSNDDLTIEITGSNCWLSVKDEKNKILVQGEYKQGDILKFKDSESYSLIIGIPKYVKVTFDNKEIPLATDGRVARITLSKN